MSSIGQLQSSNVAAAAASTADSNISSSQNVTKDVISSSQQSFTTAVTTSSQSFTNNNGIIGNSASELTHRAPVLTTIADMTSYGVSLTSEDATSGYGYWGNDSSGTNSSLWTRVVDVDEFLQQKNDEFSRLVLPAMVFLGILAIVGVCGNCLVLYVYNQKKLRKGTIRWFVQALAVFDLLSCVVAIPGEIFDMRNNHTFGTSPMCQVLRTVSMFCTVASGMTLMVVAVERYKRICTPLRKQILPRGAQVIITLCVVASSICAAPASFLYGKQTTSTDNPFINASDCSISDAFIGTLFPVAFLSFQFMLFVVGAVGLSVLYLLIARKILAHAHFRKMGFSAGAHRRMSYVFNGSECSSPTTDDTIFSFPVAVANILNGKKNGGGGGVPVVVDDDEEKSRDSVITYGNNEHAGVKTNKNNNNNNNNKNNNNNAKHNRENGSAPARSSAGDNNAPNGVLLRRRKTPVYEKPSFDATDEDVSEDGLAVDKEEASSLGCDGLADESVGRKPRPKPESASVDTTPQNSTDDFLGEIDTFLNTADQPESPSALAPESGGRVARTSSSRTDKPQPDDSKEGSPSAPSVVGGAVDNDDVIKNKHDEDNSAQPTEAAADCEDEVVVMRHRPAPLITKPMPASREDSMASNATDQCPVSPTDAAWSPKALDYNGGSLFKTRSSGTSKRPSPPSRQTSRDRHKSGDSATLKGRYYRRRSTQRTQTDMRRFVYRSDSVKAGTRRTTFMLFLITLVFLLSFLPYLVLMLLKVMDQDSLSGRGGMAELAHNILLRSYFINSMANPIIYSFCSKTFRSESSKALHCRCCKT